MVAVGRADKPVVRNVQQLPKLLDARNHLIYILLWGDAGSFCLLFDLLPMLVGTGEEQDVKPLHPFITRHDICCNGAIAMPDVQLVRRIIDRCCNIKCFSLTIHLESPP